MPTCPIDNPLLRRWAARAAVICCLATPAFAEEAFLVIPDVLAEDDPAQVPAQAAALGSAAVEPEATGTISTDTVADTLAEALASWQAWQSWRHWRAVEECAP